MKNNSGPDIKFRAAVFLSVDSCLLLAYGAAGATL